MYEHTDCHESWRHSGVCVQIFTPKKKSNFVGNDSIALIKSCLVCVEKTNQISIDQHFTEQIDFFLVGYDDLIVWYPFMCNNKYFSLNF